jgi:tripartite-type tricarboxylate transporter receptor subunit TctC
MLTDLMRGEVHVAFEPMLSSIEHIKAGTLRALAVTTMTRSEALPDLPTVGEFVPGYDTSGWTGVGVPAGTPAEIVETLNREVNSGLADPAVKQRLAELGGSPLAGSSTDFGSFVREEVEKWRKVIRAANIKPG